MSGPNKRNYHVRSDNPKWAGDEATKGGGWQRAIRWYPSPEGFEHHHIDGDPLNNDPENIKFLTRKQHMIEDGRMEALIARNKENPIIGSDNAMWKGDEASERSKLSRETRRRRREGEIILPGFTDRKHSDETRKKMSKARKRYWERKKIGSKHSSV